ncbi:MAG: hypothetical protein Q8R38_02835 [Candidatus Omnitrophota bacterium]|nr:hypothetical protein [Candidatus Omnitrophota bacterium]
MNSAKLASAMERICAQALLGLLRACGLARFTAIKERKSIFNRSLVVIDEASRRGYGTRVLRLCGRETHYFELCAGRAIHFRGLPLADGQALSGIPFGIIEANSLPYIDMHHFPVTGAPRNVAGAILDEVERRYCEG